MRDTDTTMSSNQVYLNGRIVDADDARISVSDAAFLHGASVFTTMLARNGLVFRLERHLDRLMDTVAMLGFRTDATRESLRDAARRVLEANALSDARMRITLTPGSIRNGEPTTLVTAEALPEYPQQWYEEGISVIVSSSRQAQGGPTVGHKTGCYLPRVLARQEAAASGAEEALWYTPDNRLAEACFCNVFLVMAGKVLTPPLETPVLGGVVREAVIELCDQLEIPCDYKTPLSVHEMLAAEEMFLTASCSGIRPVVRVERHAVGGEKPGPITRRIMTAYGQLLDTECPKDKTRSS